MIYLIWMIYLICIIHSIYLSYQVSGMSNTHNEYSIHSGSSDVRSVLGQKTRGKKQTLIKKSPLIYTNPLTPVGLHTPFWGQTT